MVDKNTQATITVLKETKELLYDVKTGRDTWDTLMVRLVKVYNENYLRSEKKIEV